MECRGRRRHFRVLWLLVFASVLSSASHAGAELRAFSLKAAAEVIRAGVNSDEVRYLGRITRPFAVVYATGDGDVVLVGYNDPGAAVLTADCLAVALRVAFVRDEEASVSIDPTPDTPKSGRMAVNFTGGIERTSLGKAFLEADILLKKLALGDLDAHIAGIRSYLELTVDEARQRGVDPVVAGSPYARFWWYPIDPRYEPSHGIFAVGLGVGASVSQHPSGVANKKVPAKPQTTPEADATFARTLTAGYEELAQEFPALAALKPLFKLLALCKLLKEAGEAPALEFWLHEYNVQLVHTPEEYPLLVKKAKLGGQNSLVLRIRGGVECRLLLRRLRDGDISAVRDAVLKSRADSSAISWRVPISNWNPDVWSVGSQFEVPKIGSDLKRRLGCSLLKDCARHLDAEAGLPFSLGRYAPPTWQPRLQRDLFKGATSSNVGGVMLSGRAYVAGTEGAEACVARGNFSLVVGGENARVDPLVFRKFITALWCVYYSEQDPGISIDPIGGKITPETKKHLVRYIGRVINTDLARVMRQADYLMKKWAVGTELPDYRGFKPVDGWMRHYGLGRSGISRRFWFVPEQLRFRRGGDLVLFDSGRMRLHTEYDLDGLRGQASEADRRFAQFFTDHYDELAERYPVYKELLEYAKLVALAKYLKEQGVPLLWFLLAHKDLVLTEDSPGTVDQLVKGSDYIRGMTLMGGVNLSPKSQYVYDEEAVAAIRKALALGSEVGAAATAARRPHRPVVAVRPVSFRAGNRDYTVLPQHSLTSGKDHHGNRFQTDVAVRRDGSPGLELVRYFDPRRRDSGQFGRGWHLLIPYRVRPADEKTREFLNAVIPARMVVENLLAGRREVLTFSPDRYACAGYVPEKPQGSQLIGLFLMSNASFRLVDKLGNQFHFDPSGRMTDMFLSPSPKHHMHIAYADDFTAAFVQPPYQARPADGQRVAFLNARIPKRIRVTDRIHNHTELLTFDANGRIPGYVPNEGRTSRFRIAALLTNGGLELLDRHGNRIRLTPGWDFDAIRPAPDAQIVRSVSMGGHKVKFAYTLDRLGRVVIATAAFCPDKPRAVPEYIVRYEHDEDGRLCRVERRRFVRAAGRAARHGHVAMATRHGPTATGPAGERPR